MVCPLVDNYSLQHQYILSRMMNTIPWTSARQVISLRTSSMILPFVFMAL